MGTHGVPGQTGLGDCSSVLAGSLPMRAECKCCEISGTSEVPFYKWAISITDP